MENVRISVKDHTDLAGVMAASREMARKLGMKEIHLACLELALLESASTLMAPSGVGTCRIADESDSVRLRLRVEVDGYGHFPGSAVDLDCAARLVDEFSFVSEPDHTRVSFSIQQARTRPDAAERPPRMAAVIEDFEKRFSFAFEDGIAG